MQTFKHIVFFTFSVILCSCHYGDYANSEKKDTKRVFTQKKKFMLQTSFEGVIKEKRSCATCNFNKYTLEIRLSEGSDTPSFSDKQYQPYYNYNNDSMLVISVASDIYIAANIGEAIKKPANANYIIIQNQNFKFLNDNETLWLP